jgi:hypothetical protein
MFTENQEFYSILQLSIKLSIHPNTIRRHIKSGKILALKLGTPKKWLYRIPGNEIQKLMILNIEKYIDQRVDERIKSTSTS